MAAVCPLPSLDEHLPARGILSAMRCKLKESFLSKRLSSVAGQFLPKSLSFRRKKLHMIQTELSPRGKSLKTQGFLQKLNGPLEFRWESWLYLSRSAILGGRCSQNHQENGSDCDRQELNVDMRSDR